MRPLSPAVLLVGLCLATSAAIAIVGLLASLDGRSIRGSVRCAWRGLHDPSRHPLGGFRCRDCGEPGATLRDLGFGEGSDYVTPPVVHEARAQVRDISPAPIATDLQFYRPSRRRS